LAEARSCWHFWDVYSAGVLLNGSFLVFCGPLKLLFFSRLSLSLLFRPPGGLRLCSTPWDQLRGQFLLVLPALPLRPGVVAAAVVAADQQWQARQEEVLVLRRQLSVSLQVKA
jgi:hypothetical protein